LEERMKDAPKEKKRSRLRSVREEKTRLYLKLIDLRMQNEAKKKPWLLKHPGW